MQQLVCLTANVPLCVVTLAQCDDTDRQAAIDVSICVCVLSIDPSVLQASMQLRFCVQASIMHYARGLAIINV